MADVRVEYMALDDLRRWDRNPKAHDVPALRDSLRRFGFVAPVVVDEARGVLVAGHGRCEAVAAMRADGEVPPERVRVAIDGRWLVPVVRGVGFANEQEAAAYALADNRLVESGGYDCTLLLDALTALAPDGGLAGTGWRGEDIAAMVAEPEMGGGAADVGLPTPLENTDVEGWGKPARRVIIIFADEDEEADFFGRAGIEPTDGKVVYRWSEWAAGA